MSVTPPLADTLARRAVERSIADKQAELASEIERVVETTFDLVERTGDVDPSMRQILAHTGLSTQAFYRHFQSKDELMLALLDEGRRRLVDYLERRMQRAQSPTASVRAWVEGVMAQASDTKAARRTRPFVVGEARLAEMFPDEHRASVDLLVALLLPPLTAIAAESGDPAASDPEEQRRTAEAVYRLTFGTLHDHLIGRRQPAPSTTEHLVGFVLRGAGARDDS